MDFSVLPYNINIGKKNSINKEREMSLIEKDRLKIVSQDGYEIVSIADLLHKDFKFPLLRVMYEDIFRNKVYEHEECVVKSGDAIVDIGSNVGMFARYACDKGASKVYCFEPDEKNYNCLIKNVRANCETFEQAVGEKVKDTLLYQDINIGGHSIYNNDINETKTKLCFSVDCISLDSFFEARKLEKIDFLKIDAEGAEYDIFKGLSDENLQKIDKIALEWHHFIHDFKPYCEEVIQRLKPRFNFYRLDYRGGHLSMVYFWKKEEALKTKKSKFDRIVAHTSFLGHTGYANHSREFFTALDKLCPVRVRNFAHTTDLSYLTQHQRDMVIEQHWEEPPYKVGIPYVADPNEKSVNIVLNESNHYFFYDEYEKPLVFYNVWESTRQTDEFFKRLLIADQMWVPTEWQRKVTIEQGYPEDKIKVVPEGVDGNIFTPLTSGTGIPWEEFADRFTFMIFGRWDYRKSIQEMIQAFLDTFESFEPVDLVLSVDNSFSIDGMNSTEQRLAHYNLEDNRIKVLHFPPFEEYVKYLQTGNVFLSCSRSEGWNLPLIEAIACGTISICSDYGAQLEFAKGIAQTVNIKEHRAPKHVFMAEEGSVPGTWAEPDFEHLQHVMRETYENYATLKRKALEDSVKVREKFTWQNAADIAYKNLQELSDKTRIYRGADLEKNKLEILVTINHLNTFRGSELYTYTLASRLEQRGYKVTIYTPDDDPEKDPKDNRLVDMFSDISIPIFYELDSIQGRHFDIIHLQHNSTVEDICRVFPNVPKVFLSHGVLPELEKPSVDFKIDKYLAVSEEVKENLESQGIDNVSIVRNPVDISIFASDPDFPLNEVPKKALIISNHITKKEGEVITAACEHLDIDITYEGKYSGYLPPQELAKKIQQVDIVFSLGRGIIETMLCGKVPIVYDYNGGDGMVTPTNMLTLRKKNFSGRTNNLTYTKPQLTTAIRQVYRKASGEELRKQALKYFDADIITTQFEEIYKQTIEENETKSEVFVIGCHADTEQKQELLRQTISKIQEAGIPIVLTTHYPIPPDIQKDVDYVLYEKENILSGDQKLHYWFHFPGYVKVVGSYEKGDYQSVAIISLIRNALEFCKGRYTFMHYIESDSIINLPEYLNKVHRGFREKKKCVCFNWVDKITFITNIFSVAIDWFDKKFERIKSWEDYIKVDEVRAKRCGRGGNWVFESWLHTLFEAQDLYKDTLLLTEEDKKTVIIERNIIDKGKDEPLFRIFVAETKDNKVVLFIINDSEEGTSCFIWKEDEQFRRWFVEPHSVVWELFNKEGQVFDVEIGDVKKQIVILPDKIYDDVTFKFFKEDIDIKALNWTWGEETAGVRKANCHFVDGPFLELTGVDRGSLFCYQIIDQIASEVIYDDILPTNHYVRGSKKYFSDCYLCRITDSKTKEIIFEHSFDLQGKRVLINLDSKSLGDSLAWVPYLEKFRKKHSCTVIASTFWNSLFEEEYPDIEFVTPGTVVQDLYASYTVGCFNPPEEEDRSPRDYRTLPLQQVATDILGLKYEEARPKVTVSDQPRDIEGEYVCIAIHSTAQAKYWNHPTGWQKVVDFLKGQGYKVVLLSKENAKYMGNKPPQGVIKKTKMTSIKESARYLKDAKLFIGLSSGLSWLAWAVETPVVLISGHTKPWYEFQAGVRRIYSPDGCSGCFNDSKVIFDKGDWLWCPFDKDFECTKRITPEVVINSIKEVLRIEK